ncbi:MAG: polyribonucleotide nucleotidyltransferase [Pseudomonadota bacterium]
MTEILHPHLEHNSKKIHTERIQVGNAEMVFDVGRTAKQASGSVWLSYGESTVLITATSDKSQREGIDFFPLTVDYIEKTYSAGKIPGGFFKRETRPRDYETLVARITDRSIRPLFPKGYKNEVQVIATVLSFDGVHETDIMALTGASLALHVSDVPWCAETGPIAGVRVGRVGGTLIVNPSFAQREEGDLDLFVAASRDAIVMVEGGADEVIESELVEALFFAHEQIKPIIAAIERVRTAIGKPKREFAAPEMDKALLAHVEKVAFEAGFKDAMTIPEKLRRYAAFDDIKAKVIEKLAPEYPEREKEIKECYSEVKHHTMRHMVLADKRRIDGRGFTDIRPIVCEVGVLPRTHGSAIFTRGETQGLATVTLGTRQDEQKIDNLLGDFYRRFMLHYNFPPFSVGECKRLGTINRREIGHGALAERAHIRMQPTAEKFPYTVRVVSETLESNGSSSMAAVCGATLAMLDAGVPLKAPVAGIAMGLIKEGADMAVLSDILGDEDHLGDMDFKVCGTAKGVTAVQMDIKIGGLTKEIMASALDQARAGRQHILGKILETIPEPRAELSLYAPRIHTLKINPDRIRDVIGPGGKVIRDITAKSGAKIDVEDDGTIHIASVGGEAASMAIRMIEELTQEATVGKIYLGNVRRVVDFGAFVEIFPGTDGLIHISELADKRVEKVTDVVQIGDEVVVKVINVDKDGKVRLSRKQAIGRQPGEIDS